MPRIFSFWEADGESKRNTELIIPLDKFGLHVGKFQYNLNISGYRLSMTNRFIESFMDGTAVLTDKLYVKWYKPFTSEVIKTVEMGYLPLDGLTGKN